MESVVASGEGRIGLDVGTSKLMTIRQAETSSRNRSR